MACLEQHFLKIYVYFQNQPSSPGEKKVVLLLKQNYNIPKQCDNIFLFIEFIIYLRRLCLKSQRVNCCANGFFLENYFELFWYVRVHHMLSKTPAFKENDICVERSANVEELM